MSDLVCQPAPCGGNVPPLPHPSQEVSDLVACLSATSSDSTSIVDNLDSCVGSAYQVRISGGSFWPDYIIGLSIGRLDKIMAPITLLTSDLFGPNGEYNKPNFTLEPGLYSIGLILDDGMYVPIYKEFKKTVSFSRNLSEFLNATISPVPIEENEFNLHLEANATLKFDYILYDFSGNELYRKNFVIHQYQITQLKISQDVLVL